MGVFGKNSTPPNKVKRNTFDLSHQNNLTMEFGKIYPILHEAVLPGDTFTLDLAAGLRAMPTAFPIQTKLRLDVHAFYVRNRNLYDDFQNFIGRTGNWASGSPTDGLSFPVINPERYKEIFKTSSLGDYLGLPSTVVGKNTVSSTSEVHVPFMYASKSDNLLIGSYGGYGESVDCGSSGQQACYSWPSVTIDGNDSVVWGRAIFNSSFFHGKPLFIPAGSTLTVELQFDDLSEFTGGYTLNTFLSRYIPYIAKTYLPEQTELSSIKVMPNFGSPSRRISYRSSDGVTSAEVVFEFPVLKSFRLFDKEPMDSIGLQIVLLADPSIDSNADPSLPGLMNTADWPSIFINKGGVSFTIDGFIEAVDAFPDGAYANFPVVSALPFRAYESIYNAFYRDQRNNPYVVDGVSDPNVYLPTKSGGPDDDTPCTFRHRNWEQDFITSGVPSPQQGAAPLVGITSTGVATFADEDGVLHRVKLTTADDGDTIIGAEYEKNLPDSVARALVGVASSGISINDFRGVNSLQRWLEVNMRRGLKYRDQIKSHFGVTPSYAELDMPEFIGGMSRYISTMQVDQTAPATGEQPNPLGSYAGQLALSESFNHKIRHYCDEHGYIMVLASIVPVPCYSQVLNKDWIKKDTLDFYFPEFGHLGMQPITYQEVAPLQASYLGTEVTKTYAYQRAWYEYMARTDEVHGDFRTTLKDFCLYREFDSLPVLSEEFLTVRPSQLNNIFLVSEYTDPDTGEKTPIAPFLGQFHFNEVLKRPIPRYGIPRLE